MVCETGETEMKADTRDQLRLEQQKGEKGERTHGDGGEVAVYRCLSLVASLWRVWEL